MRLQTVSIALLSLVASLSAACSSSAHLKAPEGFAELRDKTFDTRVASSDGVVVGVRSHDNALHGNLDFWTGVLSQNLLSRSYQLEDATPRTVKTAKGLEGRQIRYSVDSEGRRYEYWLTLFVTDKRVYVVEAGGDGASFGKKIAPKVDQAIESLDAG